MLRGSLIAVLAAMMLALAPGAVAADQPKVAFDGAFELDATDGYSIFGLVFSTGTVGGVTLIVSDGHGSAIYSARGAGTAESVDVGLGALGKVDVRIHPTGATETIHKGCEGKGEAVSIPAYELVGSIEFRGEHGFTEASTTQTPVLFESLLNLACGGFSVGEVSGETLPGVGLKAESAGGPSFMLQQNHPGAPVYYHAAESGTDGAVQVERTVSGHLGAGALRYAPALRSASFSAARPFRGSATYQQRTPPHEARPGRGVWRGSLKVDFPGDPAVRLAGPGFKASIIHSSRSESHE